MGFSPLDALETKEFICTFDKPASMTTAYVESMKIKPIKAVAKRVPKGTLLLGFFASSESWVLVSNPMKYVTENTSPPARAPNSPVGES